MIARGIRALVDLVRDLRTPYEHRCPICRERVGGNLGAHVSSAHTPAELQQHYARRREAR